jgi:uncharacterized protein
LLRFIPGLNPLYAQRIEQKRKELTQFPSRQAILDMENIDRQALQQAIPFLRVNGSQEPLDRTPVHPEDYLLAWKILEACHLTREQLLARLAATQAARSSSPEAPPEPAPEEDPGAWNQALDSVSVCQLADECGTDVVQVGAVVAQLKNVGVDPWSSTDAPVLREAPVDWNKVHIGDQVVGTINHLVDFGAFVGLGPDRVGLLHVSRVSDTYVADAKEVLDEGEQLRFWVVELDNERNRTSLSLVPHMPRERSPRSERKSHSESQQRSHQRPPRQYQGRREPEGRQRARVARAPKPLVPITEAMKDGTEPMRTFSDLAQFFEHQKSHPPTQKKPENESE